MRIPRPRWAALLLAELRGTWNSVYARVPVLCALGGALLAISAGAPTLSAGGAALGLAIAGVLGGRLLARRHQEALAAIKHDADAEIARVVGLCAQSTPVWMRQIETARGEADTEVAELARVFGDIAGKLDKVMGGSELTGSRGGAAQEQVLGALRRNGLELETLVSALQLLQTSKQRMVEEIGLEAARLKENASDIRQIALHIRMVSLNATIEAARAGAAGKPFAVIVADMRELAVRTAEASDLFSRHTDRLHGMVSAAFQEREQTDSQIVSIAGAEALVEKVVASSEAMMRELTEAIASMEEERRGVRQDISRALVSLQFQDRVSQILSHVTRNLQEMQERIHGGSWHEMDEREWQERMASDYSTHEEFGNHSAARLSTVQPASAVTFF